MVKIHEISDPNSCLNRAASNEFLFVLLARDAAAPQTIRFWIDERIRLGKNMRDDAQIQAAEVIADVMERQYQFRKQALDNR